MLSTPWDAVPVQYAGWIPNALGHLSFSHLGARSRAHVAVRRDIAKVQHVVAHQAQQTAEYGLPNWVMRQFRPGLVHDWVLVGSTMSANYPSGGNSGGNSPARSVFSDEQGMLRGTLYLLPDMNSRPAGRWTSWRVRGNFRRNARKIISGVTRSYTGGAPLDHGNRQMEGLIQELQAQGVTFLTIQFALIRTGEARFWLEDRSPLESQESEDTAVRSAFVFLQEVAYKPSRNHPIQAPLFPLIRIGDDNEVEWQRMTMWSLLHFIEDHVQRAKTSNLREALNIITYAEVFQRLYSGMVRSREGHAGFIPINNLYYYGFQELRSSVTLQLESRSTRLAFATAAIGPTFAIALSSVILAVNLSPDRAAWPEVFAVIGDHPIPTVVVVLTLLWVSYETILREAAAETAPFALLRFVRRLTLATTVSLYQWIGFPRAASPVIEFAVQFAGFAAALWGLAHLLGIW